MGVKASFVVSIPELHLPTSSPKMQSVTPRTMLASGLHPNLGPLGHPFRSLVVCTLVCTPTLIH
jgi:hypothetical protein